MRAYQVLADVCSLFHPDPAGPGINELKVWSTVHGYAMLSLFRRGQQPGGTPVDIALLLPNLTPRRQAEARDRPTKPDASIAGHLDDCHRIDLAVRPEVIHVVLPDREARPGRVRRFA
jgi:hypothetical protein